MVGMHEERRTSLDAPSEYPQMVQMVWGREETLSDEAVTLVGWRGSGRKMKTLLLMLTLPLLILPWLMSW